MNDFDKKVGLRTPSQGNCAAQRTVGRSKMNIEVFTDFDGTVTDRDSIVFLTQKFGGGEEYRQQALTRYGKGEIDLFELIREELATVTVPWNEAARSLNENISVDSHFPSFVEWCGHRGYPVSVVSSGILQVVSLFIGDLGVPFHAHPVEMKESGWVYQKDERADKANLLREAKARCKVVYIGDGISDISAVPYADFLFAKSRLAGYCQEQTIPFFSFRNFREVQERLGHRLNV